MQLSFTRSSIKNRFLEEIEEFKEFKFQQNLRLEVTKNDEVFKNKVFADPWIDSEKTEFFDINFNELLHVQHHQLLSRVERWIYEGSVCAIHSISKVPPCEGSSLFSIPYKTEKSSKNVDEYLKRT